MTIAKRIVEIRTLLNLTQTDLAEKLKISKSAVSHMERGERSVTERTISDICEKLNVNRKWLTDGVGDVFTEAETESVLDLLKKEYNLDGLDIEIIRSYLCMSPIERQVFKDFILGIKNGEY